MDNEKYQKTEDPNFVKDKDTGALVSTDLVAFRKHKIQQRQLEESKTQKNELNSIKSEDISEIKDLLQQLLKP